MNPHGRWRLHLCVTSCIVGLLPSVTQFAHAQKVASYDYTDVKPAERLRPSASATSNQCLWSPPTDSRVDDEKTVLSCTLPGQAHMNTGPTVFSVEAHGVNP